LSLVHRGEPARGVAILIASRHPPPSACPRHLTPDTWYPQFPPLTVYCLPPTVLPYRITYAFSAQKPDRFLQTLAQWVHFRAKTVFFARHFVVVSCVFIHIAGSTFIFNISKGKRPVSELEKDISDPPQWGVLGKSTIENQPQAGIFHRLHVKHFVVPRS